MSDDKQKEVLSGYEQLKRRNRRRLVTTSALVFVSGILLALAVNTGNSEEKNDGGKSADKRVQNIQGDVARAAVLEPEENDAAPDEIAENSMASEPPVEVLRPQAPQAPEDVGPPLVIINDKLVDSDIKGLEESEKIQKAEASKREAEEKKQQAQIQRQNEQRAAKRAEERRAALEKEAAEKKRMAAKTDKAEREAEAKRRQQQEAAERRARQIDAAKKDASEKKESVKVKAPEDKKPQDKKKDAVKAVAKDAAKNTADNGHSKVDSKPSEKAKVSEKTPPASKERSAIQAGYAEKERAQSLQRKMKAAGINASITEIKTDKGVVYRVKSSAYKSRQEAARDLEKLRVHGIAGQVVNE